MISSKSKNRLHREELRRQAVAEFLSRNPHHFNGSEALVFVPVYNEEHTIAKVVGKVRDACDFDLMVIDDGSTDSTPQILPPLEVDVLRHPICLGSGAIVSGLEAGHSLGYKYVIKIDGDDQHNPQDIPRLYEHAVKAGADIVIGSRHLHKFTAKILSIEGSGMWFCAKLVSLLSRKRITDTTSGFKVWSRRACELVFQAVENGKLKEDSTYNVEELIIAARKKLTVQEISIVVRPREYGETKSYSTKKRIMFPLSLIRSTVRALLP
jgi:glycosyltransferase involved in cell wall biosynthesis